MKAYKVTDRLGCCGYSTIIFAETREKARVIAQHSDAFTWYNLDYIDFSVRRIPSLDKYYKGLDEMDWDNAEDRIAMVKDGNFTCSYEYVTEDLECKECPAKQWCIRYHGAECEVKQ